MSDGASAIHAEKLTKDYGAGRGIFDLDLDVAEGEVFGFLGPNGAGKTTTIKLLMGLSHATRGAATIFGLDADRDAVAVKKRVGYVPGELPQFGGGRAHLRPRRDRPRGPSRHRGHARPAHRHPRASRPDRVRRRAAGRAAARPHRLRGPHDRWAARDRPLSRELRRAASRDRRLARGRAREPRAHARGGLPQLLLRGGGVILFRLALRSHRTGTIATAAIGGISGLLNTIAYAQVAGATHAERAAFAHSMELLGQQLSYLLPRPVQLDTMGGYLTWRAFSAVAIVYAVWAMLAATGAGRGDEEKGLTETWLATGVSR